jgi:cob(I)alamin adenosyltransferase
MAQHKRRGLVIVHTGHGKGKTTAALGILMRAWGRNMKVCILQFFKHKKANWGEEKAAKRMGVEMIPLGEGFTWKHKDLERYRKLTAEAWQVCKEKILSGYYDIVILDEIIYAFKYGWLDINEVLDTLRQRDPRLHVILTGRDAPEALIEFADLVTEMRLIKHPFEQGIKAQRGIEF